MKKLTAILFALLSLNYLSATTTATSPSNSVDEMPKRHSQIIVKPATQTTTPHRGLTDHIEAYYEDGGIYITLWGEGELVEIEVCNTTNGNYLAEPAEGSCSMVDISDMGCGEYSLLIYCDNHILYTGDFAL